MSTIKDIDLAFPSQEELEVTAEDEFCSLTYTHAIIDFRCPSTEALRRHRSKPNAAGYKFIFNTVYQPELHTPVWLLSYQITQFNR